MTSAIYIWLLGDVHQTMIHLMVPTCMLVSMVSKFKLVLTFWANCCKLQYISGGSKHYGFTWFIYLYMVSKLVWTFWANHHSDFCHTFLAGGCASYNDTPYGSTCISISMVSKFKLVLTFKQIIILTPAIHIWLGDAHQTIIHFMVIHVFYGIRIQTCFNILSRLLWLC